MYSPPVIFVGALILSVKSVTAQGAVQLFSDSGCTNPTGPSTSLLSNSCLETNGTAAISAISLPTCDDGKPNLMISDLNECGTPSISPEVSTESVGVCLFFPTGSGIGSAAVICVGRVTSSVSNNAPPMSTTAKSSTRPKSTTATPLSPASSQPPSHGDGISLSDRINLGVGIGVGGAAIVVTVVLGILQLQRMRKQWLHSQLIAGNEAPPAYDTGYEMPAWQPPAY